ncbi:MAG TPA: 5'-3' exonuclease H3TH domain-containing protein [Acidimicrobiia bacterium]|nr:5'-3' exonuclease H3TH domain-containing protein [Acidimicrobiia bacterium]
MRVHLVDGTYELFRQYLAPRPGHLDADGVEVGASRAVVASMLTMLEDGATHLGVACDHVIESFRNDLWETYKDGSGIDPLLKNQFPILEDALAALGVTVWPMVEFEADDALGAAAVVAADDPRVEQVIICTPDKDMGQCVGGKVVQLDRRKDVLLDAEGVRAKFGVLPASIPDWLALVGDTADGFPGLPGFGAKSAAAVLARFGHIEAIPDDPKEWDVPGLRGADRLAATLAAGRAVAERFKVLATLRIDAPVGTVDEWEWRGPRPELDDWCTRFGSPRIAERAAKLATQRGFASS